jgi:hypothetical protein
MTESKHTPGPWSVPHFAEPDTNCECGYVLSGGQMGAIATVHCSGEGDDWKTHGDNPKFAEACANARLIAAAPDYDDGARDFVAYEDAMDRGDDIQAMVLYASASKKLRAAIAKAEGK